MTARALPLGTVAYVVALAALFLFTALFRFLQLKDGFPNDHFFYLAAAQQILDGDLPTRDFQDQGLPLMYATSVLAQMLLGRTLFAEAMVVALTFALAAVLTAAAVRELTGSRVLAVLAAVLEIAIVTRTYGYPKVLAYAAWFWLLQRYVARPTTGRLFALAVAIVTAFLFRHDHGIYLSIGGVITAWLAGHPERGGGVRRAATLVGMIAVLTAPYVIYVQVYGGLWSYLQTGLEFRAAELARQPHVWPSLFGDQPHHAALLYEYWTIPIAAALLLVAYRRRDDARTIATRVAPMIAVALLVNWTFLRDPLITRLHDAIAPAVILGSWLVACAWRARHPWVWRPVSSVLVVIVATSVMQVGATIEQLDRASLLVTWRRLPEFLREVGSELRSLRAERQLSTSRTAYILSPFYAYVDRCTTRHHRLLVGGYAPEVSVFARRGFAGGQSVYMHGYYGGEVYQRLVLQRLGREVVPFVLLPGDAAINQFYNGFPLVANYVRIRYTPLVTLGAEPATAVQILFDGSLPVAARDPETGWPCEVANEWTIYATGKRH
jgi:hypothetical protein